MTISDMHPDDRPIHELIRLAGEEWADQHAAASLKEEMKTAELSRQVNQLRREEPGLAHNKAEAFVKESDEWAAYIHDMVDARRLANRSRAKYDSLKVQFEYWRTRNANARTERMAR